MWSARVGTVIHAPRSDLLRGPIAILSDVQVARRSPGAAATPIRSQPGEGTVNADSYRVATGSPGFGLHALCDWSGHGAERTRYSGRQGTLDQRERAIGP